MQAPNEPPDIRIVTATPSASFPYGNLYISIEDHNTYLAWGFNAMGYNELPQMNETLSDLKIMLRKALTEIDHFQTQLPIPSEEPC